jgi:hypothetical protein
MMGLVAKNSPADRLRVPYHAEVSFRPSHGDWKQAVSSMVQQSCRLVPRIRELGIAALQSNTTHR